MTCGLELDTTHTPHENTPSPMTTPTPYTTAQAAEVLGLDTSSVRRLARKFKLGQRLGRDWFFSQSDLDRMRSRPSPGNPSFVQQRK
jgi:hypothetical protein